MNTPETTPTPDPDLASTKQDGNQSAGQMADKKAEDIDELAKNIKQQPSKPDTDDDQKGKDGR